MVDRRLNSNGSKKSKDTFIELLADLSFLSVHNFTKNHFISIMKLKLVAQYVSAFKCELSSSLITNIPADGSPTQIYMETKINL